MKTKFTLLMILLSTLFGSNTVKAQWTEITTGLLSNDVRSIAVSGTTIFAGTGVTGSGEIYLSTDDGTTWTFKKATPSGVWCFGINGTAIFAGTNGNGIYVSTDGGSTWNAMNTGITGSGMNVRSILIDGVNTYAATLGGLYLSSDNGVSWSKIANYAFYGGQNSLAINGINLFAGHFQGVGLSTDNGTTWAAISSGLDSSPGVNAMGINGTNIFAGSNHGIYFSNNNGGNWSKMNTGLLDTTVTSIAISGNNIFAGCKTYSGGANWGVYVSNNNGSSWTQMNTGLNYTGIQALAVNSNYIFAGTNGGHVQRRPLSQMTLAGIEEFEVSPIKLFPNPSTGKFNVESDTKHVKNTLVEVYNLLGDKVLQQQSIGEIDLSTVSKGIYFVKINEDGNNYTKKIIVE